jgi:hypothetical protein
VPRILLILLTLAFACPVLAEEPSGNEIVRRVMVSDPWGLSGAEVKARLTLTDKSGGTSQLAFEGKSLQYDPPLAKSIIRFSAPADLAGAAFLQVQKKSGDDERFLFLPELKRPRRIAGNLRAGAFMGTDFTFADLDRRDIRDSEAKRLADQEVGKFPCYVVDVVPKDKDSSYSHIEVWVRKDNSVPLRMKMYSRAGVLVKTFEANETKRVSGAWFISKSRMVNHEQKHTTDLVLEQISVKSDIPDEQFSVRALEKL